MLNWPEGVGRRLYPELDSTNAEAVRLALTGERGPLWILTLKQTAGRGRRGRVWKDPAGNFSASLLMRPTGDAASAALRSFIAALALRDALTACGVSPSELSLKWPNDVLLRERKLAGILLEGAPDYLCIGIGVNLVTAPFAQTLEVGALAPIALLDASIRVQPEELLDRLAQYFAEWDARYTTYGFAPIRTAWLSHAARLGTKITARLPDRTLAGIFETIDETGAIVLKTPAGRVVLSAAEIHFEGAPDAFGY